MKCTNCNNEIPNDSKYCKNCGTKILKIESNNVKEEKTICNNCGSDISECSNFCKQCGHAINSQYTKKDLLKFYLPISAVVLFTVYALAAMTSYFIIALGIFITVLLLILSKLDRNKKNIIGVSSVILLIVLIEFIIAKPSPTAIIEKTIYSSDINVAVDVVSNDYSKKSNSFQTNITISKAWYNYDFAINSPTGESIPLYFYDSEFNSDEKYILYNSRYFKYKINLNSSLPLKASSNNESYKNNDSDSYYYDTENRKLMASKLSDIVHVEGCFYTNRIKAENAVYFDTFAEANFYNYDTCSKCWAYVYNNY